MAFLRSTAPDIYAQKVSEYNSTALGNAARSVQGQSTATIDACVEIVDIVTSEAAWNSGTAS